MVFSSMVFLCVFLPVTLSVYLVCPEKFRNWVALSASLVFYSWGAPQFVWVLVLSSFMDYQCSMRFVPSFGVKTTKITKRNIMIAALGANIVVLAYFKYMNFFASQVFSLMDMMGWPHVEWMAVALPIGISFFTFQKISYLVDVYRGRVAPAASFSTYLLYVSFFPQLIAGPIVRYHDIAHQLAKRQVDAESVLQGFWRFSVGLGKKVLIANTLGEVADHAFSHDLGPLSASAAWLGAICYSFQIYFDFSGYSDMAIGLGRMLGFKFLENFNCPYIARNFTEFWGRWHISLSNWMKSYLYIPLGGNRCGPVRRVVNLWIVFLISGFWHGAAWNFLIWGAYHGFFLSMDKLMGKQNSWIPSAIKIFMTFILITIGWVFFRHENMSQSVAYLCQMVTMGTHSSGSLDQWVRPHHWMILGIAGCLSFAPALMGGRTKAEWQIFGNDAFGAYKLAARSMATAGLLVASFAVLAATNFNPFIYFRF